MLDTCYMTKFRLYHNPVSLSVRKTLKQGRNIRCRLFKKSNSALDENLPQHSCLKRLLLGVLFALLIVLHTSVAYGVDFYSKSDSPAGRPYDLWVGDWWNWTASILNDGTSPINADGLKEGGCLIYEKGSITMLMDTALGNKKDQVCKISSAQSILIPIWTGECDRGKKYHENDSIKQLSECAKEFDLGDVTGQVKVDNILVANLDVKDSDVDSNIGREIIRIDNVTEIYTRQFNMTYPPGSHLEYVQPGTFVTVAHGWFVFLKPLSVGDHTVYYQNTVAGANSNVAEITYQLKVE